MGDRERLHPRRMPFWMWLTLSLVLLALGQSVVTTFTEWRGWPDWTHMIIRAITFAIFYAVVSPRISRARQAFSERRRQRKQTERPERW